MFVLFCSCKTCYVAAGEWDIPWWVTRCAHQCSSCEDDHAWLCKGKSNQYTNQSIYTSMYKILKYTVLCVCDTVLGHGLLPLCAVKQCLINEQTNWTNCSFVFSFSPSALLNVETHRGAWRTCAAGPSYSRKRIQNILNTMTTPSSSHARALALLACRVGNFLPGPASHLYFTKHWLMPVNLHINLLFFSAKAAVRSSVNKFTW